MRKTIYLAGPDVFLPDAKEQGERLKGICRRYGYEGLFPLDNELSGETPEKLAGMIREANVAMIRRCDLVIANLNPFRGPEPDSGTVWEVGFAAGLGKPVYGHSADTRSLKEKTVAMLDLEPNSTSDKGGMMIEDFGLTHNLMFAHIVVAQSLEGVLRRLEKIR